MKNSYGNFGIPLIISILFAFALIALGEIASIMFLDTHIWEAFWR